MGAGWGWLGAVMLILAGYGWGRQVAGVGVTGSWLIAMLALTLAGLWLTGGAALGGQDLPLVVGAVGAVVASLFSVYSGE